MIVHFATSNAAKVENAQVALRPFGVTVRQLAADLIESRAEDPAEIALEKAVQAYREFRKPLIVEDSGFFIDALGGFPMTHVKFSLKTLGIEGVLRAMRGVKDRGCQWRMTLAYAYGAGKHKTFTCVERGTVATRPHPVKRPMMSDYWRIYVPTSRDPANTKSLSDLSETDMRAQNDWFARHNQFMMFGRWLKKHI